MYSSSRAVRRKLRAAGLVTVNAYPDKAIQRHIELKKEQTEKAELAALSPPFQEASGREIEGSREFARLRALKDLAGRRRRGFHAATVTAKTDADGKFTMSDFSD